MRRRSPSSPTAWAAPRRSGLYFTVRLALMAVAAPFVATLADRLPRRTVMIACDLTRFVLVAGAALCLYAGTPSWPVFGLAGLASLAGAAFRPAQNAWMPALADSPEELTAANGAASTLESLSFFFGPALGAFLLTLTDVPTVFMLNAATFLWSAALVAGIRARPGAVADEGDHAGAEADEEASRPGCPAARLRPVSGRSPGDRNILMVGTLLCVQTIVAGASAVFGVVMAVEILHAGSKGVGYIDSAFGVGAIVGGFVAIGRARKRRLRLRHGARRGAVVASRCSSLWLWPTPVAVFAVIILMGFGNPLVDVNFATHPAADHSRRGARQGLRHARGRLHRHDGAGLAGDAVPDRRVRARDGDWASSAWRLSPRAAVAAAGAPPRPRPRRAARRTAARGDRDVRAPDAGHDREPGPQAGPLRGAGRIGDRPRGTGVRPVLRHRVRQRLGQPR